MNAGAGVALAYVALGAVTFTAWFVAARVLRLERPAIGSVMCCALIANTGYLGYPLVAALLGFDALSEAVVYDVLVSAPALLLGAFSVGAAFGERAGEGVRERIAAFFTRNPPLYAALLAVIAPDSLAPDVLVDASRIAIVAVLPLASSPSGQPSPRRRTRARSRCRRRSTLRSPRRSRSGSSLRPCCST